MDPENLREAIGRNALRRKNPTEEQMKAYVRATEELTKELDPEYWAKYRRRWRWLNDVPERALARHLTAILLIFPE